MDDIRDQLRAAATRYQATGREHDAAQAILVERVVAALKADMAPTEVIALSSLSGAYVRKIAREHGIPPARLGRKPRQTRP